MNGTLRLPQVIVTIEFEQRARGCNTTMTMNCQRAFNTYIYESSIESSTGAARNVNDYEQVLSVSSADHTSGNRVSKKTITINFATNHSSFYFAIQDESSCTVVTRLIVSYTVCPAQTSNLISYPEIVSPSGLYDGLPSNISVSAMCIENAQPENGVAPVVTCSAEGVWAGTPWPGLGCRCVLGYFIEIFNDSETCNRKALVHYMT